MQNIILQCRDLTKSYGGKLALDHVNLEVFSGRIVGLLGPNGSGKTTLIKLANGLLSPTAGEIRINGARPGIETKKIISYLPDQEYLNNWMRVGDLVEFFREFYSDFREQRAWKCSITSISPLAISSRISPRETRKRCS